MTDALYASYRPSGDDLLRERIAQTVEQYYWAVDQQWRAVRFLGERFEDIYGMPRAAVFADALAWLRAVEPEDVARCRAWVRAVGEGSGEEVEFRIMHPRRGLRWIRARALPLQGEYGEPLLGGVAEDITRRRALQQAQIEKVEAQRDVVVREVHHRIKNNLQTVVALLRREARKHPEAQLPIEAAIGQVQSVAVVHGLQGRNPGQRVLLCELLPVVAGNVSELMSVPILRTGVGPGEGALMLKESETVAVALILNELITNAVKHSCAAKACGLLVTLRREGAAARIRIANPGRLAPDFDFSTGQGLGTGLGLVRALLPETGMDLRFDAHAEHVAVEIFISAPLVVPFGVACVQRTGHDNETTPSGR